MEGSASASVLALASEVTEEELEALRLRLAELRHELEQRGDSVARSEVVCGAGSNGEAHHTRQTSIIYSRSAGGPDGALDIDSTAVPHPVSAGPFGREGTAQRLTNSSVH